MKDASKNLPKAVSKKPTSPAVLKHAAQLEKLQKKFVLETTVLEEIKNFLRQKALLEKECAVAVLKLATQFANKRDFLNYWDTLHGSSAAFGTAATGASEDQIGSQTNKPLTLAQVWKAGLSEIQKQQAFKISIYDEVSKSVEELKAPKIARVQQFKQAMNVAIDVQNEINTVVNMIQQSKKIYNDSEKIVQEMQSKTKKLEEKSKRHPKGAKVPEKIAETLHTAVPKAVAARNEYMLSVAGGNAHLSRYYSHDLFYVSDLINGNTYDLIRGVLNSVFTAEHRISPETHKTYEALLTQVDRLSSRKDIECFFTTNPVLSEPVLYNFEPYPGDTNTTLTLNKDSQLDMEKCARKWAMRLVENDLAQKKLVQQLTLLTSQGTEITTVEGRSAMNTKMFSLRESLRRAATFQQKSEAILDLLKQGGVDVQNWLESARVGIEQKNAVSGPEIISTLPPKPIKHNQLSTEDDRSASGDAVRIENNSEPVTRCIALYEYVAGRPDELSLTVDQELLVVSGSTDGEWLLVENSDCISGYVPANYVQIVSDSNPTSPSHNTESEMRDAWKDSVEANALDGWNADPSSTWEVDESSSWAHRGYSYNTESTYNYDTSADANEIDTSNVNQETSGYCRALYDRESDDPEELSFQEGDIIHIISKSSSDVDDGYWTGELKGKIGVFLSLLTEEILESDFTSDIGTSVSSTPSPQPNVKSGTESPKPPVPPRPRGF